MGKPIKRHIYDPMFDWKEIEGYIKKEYGKDIRDWEGRFTIKNIEEKKPYHDFWHYIVDTQEIHNGCVFYLYFDNDTYGELENWKKEIVDLLVKEGFLDEKREGTFWVSW